MRHRLYIIQKFVAGFKVEVTPDIIIRRGDDVGHPPDFDYRYYARNDQIGHFMIDSNLNWDDLVAILTQDGYNVTG